MTETNLPHNHLRDIAALGRTVISLEGVDVDFGGRAVLEGVDIDLRRGDFMAVTGPNGGGKTTLLRTMLRLIKPSRGKVRYFDTGGRETRHLHIGYLPQKSAIDTRFPILVEEVVLSGLYHGMRCRVTPADRSRLDEMLSIVGADRFRHHPIGELSGGQLQRTLLGRALISRPEIIVLDEPLSYVDKQFERQIYGLMEDASLHATIVLVSHEMSVISDMANRHIIVDHTISTCSARHHHYIPPCENNP